MRNALLALSASALLLAALAAPVAADQTYQPERLPIAVTADGLAAGYQPLTFGQLVNQHASGPTVYANEDYVLHGAQPLTTFTVQRWFYFGDCSGPLVLAGSLSDGRDVHTTNALGNAQFVTKILPSDISAYDLHDTDWGVAFVVVDGAAVPVYSTACTEVHLD